SCASCAAFIRLGRQLRFGWECALGRFFSDRSGQMMAARPIGGFVRNGLDRLHHRRSSRRLPGREGHDRARARAHLGHRRRDLGGVPGRLARGACRDRRNQHPGPDHRRLRRGSHPAWPFPARHKSGNGSNVRVFATKPRGLSPARLSLFRPARPGGSQLRFRRAPWTMSAFRADALITSPSWKSMARTVLLSRRVLKSPFGSFSWGPFGNVSLTAFLRASPTQTMPSWDQTGTPSGREGFFHLTSSITPGSAPLIRALSWPSLSPLQPVVFRTMASICWDADASFMPMLCRGGSAPSGPKGSVPCSFDACSQTNNTPASFLPAVRT